MYMKQHTNAPGVPAPVGAYSQAIQSGSLLFCSGQIGLSPLTGELVKSSFKDEVKQVLDNLRGVLVHSGSSPERIVSTSIFLIGMDDFKEVNELYSHFVSSSCPPARQTVAVKELPLGARVEISVIAEVGQP
jgi:2-iminobutanoate/2-iminopropanoate deaminase